MHLLLFQKGSTQAFKYPLTKEKTSIGRDPLCDIVLTDKNVSRLHCEIRKKGRLILIKNLSANGTVVNSSRIKEVYFGLRDCAKIGDWTLKLTQRKNVRGEATHAGNEGETRIRDLDEMNESYLLEPVEITLKMSGRAKVVREMKRAKIKIGSSDANDIVVKDDYVSKLHCKIEAEGGGLYLTDLGSTNGTFYRGERIGRMFLPAKASFEIGRTEISVRRLTPRDDDKPARIAIGSQIIAASGAMREILAQVKCVAASSATVLVTGESGTGKEIVARAVHDESGRRGRPFVAINCGAIPPNIIESELFGHEKGAFTGAVAAHQGVFEQAGGGTLFLDEIGEMPLEMQTRLLRALETKTVRRIGGTRDIPVDARVVAATNQDLKQNVRSGKFREDLFYRLYIIPIHIPPLRERKEDIRCLAEFFVELFSADGCVNGISGKAIQRLAAHRWSGNVRELKNTIQRAVIMSKGGMVMDTDIVLLEPSGGKDALPLSGREKDLLVDAVRKFGGNQSKAAVYLGIARTTLAHKLRKYEIDPSAILR